MPVKVSKRVGQPNLAKLLEHTEHHPKGRVEIGSDGKIKGNKGKVIGYEERIVEDELGNKKKIKIPVQGGHVTEEGSVWRISLSPARYHSKVLGDEERKALTGTIDRTAPTLEVDEAKEYAAFVKYAKDEKITVPVGTSSILTPEDKDIISEANEGFYKWFKGKSVEVVNGKPVVKGSKKEE